MMVKDLRNSYAGNKFWDLENRPGAVAIRRRRPLAGIHTRCDHPAYGAPDRLYIPDTVTFDIPDTVFQDRIRRSTSEYLIDKVLSI